MKLKPKYYDSEASHRWMISYVDVLTILLILFVAVSAQSLHSRTVSNTSAAHLGRPSPFGGPPRTQPPGVLLEAQQRLERQGMHPSLEPRGLVVSLPHAVLFPSGQDEVGPGGLAALGRIAEVLREIPNKVTLIGHSDAVPIHNRRFKNNWQLSAARSLKLLELLGAKYGIAASRLSVAGYGATRPRETNDTQDGRAANRRVEIVILNEPAP